MKLARTQGFYYVNGYDHPHILAGQGTMGLEICEQVPDLDALVIPVGGGGLIAGTALAVKSLYPHVQVIVSTFVFVLCFGCGCQFIMCCIHLNSWCPHSAQRN